MPLLRFATSADAPGDEWQAFADTVADLYAEHMETGRSHIAIERTPVAREDLWLGRQEPGDLVFLDADIRAGRSHEHRRAFALAVIDEVVARWDVPAANTKVVFTEHEGELMMGYDRVGGSWSSAESPDDA